MVHPKLTVAWSHPLNVIYLHHTQFSHPHLLCVMGHCRIISHISGVSSFQALIGDEEEDAAVEAAEEGLGIGMPAPCRLADVFLFD